MRKRGEYLGENRRIIWAGSPREFAGSFNNFLKEIGFNEDDLKQDHSWIWDQDRTWILDEVHCSVDWDQVVCPISRQLNSLSWDPLHDLVWRQLVHQCWNQIINGCFGDDVYNLLWNQGEFADYDSLFQALPDKRGIKNYAKFMLPAFRAGLGLVLFLKEAVVLMPMPKYSVDEEGRTHNEQIPAIEWQSGEKEYFWHGVRVPKEVILSPETLDPKKVLLEEDVAVRRIMIDRYGQGKFLLALNPKVIEIAKQGILYGLDLPRDEPLVMVEVVCASTGKHHFLRVPPETRSVQEAIAWTFGLSSEEYRPIIET